MSYACRLLRKAVAAHGARLVVVADAPTLDAIDPALWTLRRASSSPIAVATTKRTSWRVRRWSLPTVGRGALPHRPILVNLGDDLPARFERFERLIDIVGSDDADRWRAGRAGGTTRIAATRIRTIAYGGSAN